MREKEVHINNVEFAVSDLHMQLKNAVQDQQFAEEEKNRIEVDLEELLEIQEHNENEWKENAEILTLNQQVEELQGQVETLEEQSLQDLEEAEAEKAIELEHVMKALKQKYEKIIDEKDEELESLLNDNEEELLMQGRELKSIRAAEFMRKTCNEILDNGLARALGTWSKNYSTASVTGIQRLLQTTEARLKEYENGDQSKLKELRLVVEDEVNDIKAKMATEKENAKAAQAQVLFMTTMVAKQLGEAYGATGIALMSNMLNTHHKQIGVMCFYHWKETMGPNTGNNIGTGEGFQSDGPLSPAPKSMLRNVLRNAEYQQQNATQMEYLIVNELQATMLATAQGRLQLNENIRLRNSNEARWNTIDSVHELELKATRKSENEWTIEKQYLEQELSVLKRKTDIEMGLFNQIQGSMHAERRELEETMHAEQRELVEQLGSAQSEVGQLLTQLMAEKSKGAEGIHNACEEHVNVSFKTGFWKLCWVFSSWNKTMITGKLRVWNTRTIDAKCAAVATTKQENSCLKEQFEISQHQYALTTSALR